MRWGSHNRFSIEDAKERFNAHVQRTKKCWLWTGASCSGRYGAVGFRGKHWLAHRLAFYFSTGKHPGKKIVMHICDNGFCVRPDHLMLATQHENVLDAERKGRACHPFGENHGRAVLTEAQAIDCICRHKSGASIRSLAREHHVDKVTISSLINGKTWRHLHQTVSSGPYTPRRS